MPNEMLYFEFGLAIYSAGLLFIGLSFHWFKEYSRTKERADLLAGVIEFSIGLVLALMARIPWQYTLIGVYFPR